MHLLNLTLQQPTAVTAAAVGSFSGTKGQEIIVVRGGTRLEILKLNAQTSQCESSLGLGLVRLGCSFSVLTRQLRQQFFSGGERGDLWLRSLCIIHF
jgi:hypothetical protein